MGRPTGNIERRLKLSSRSADHFKNRCDCCPKQCNAHHTSQSRSEWVRENGEVYYGAWNISQCGHLECLKVGKFASAPVVEA